MLEKREYILPCRSGEKRATLYRETGTQLRAVALYFHGGALLYGSREDLPQYHLEQVCAAGCGVLALDYPLAPGANVEEILEDVKKSVEWYLENRAEQFSAPLPYFLWGRSAGAYLCLMAMERGLPQPPAGVLSYYGYGLLRDGWYDAPSPFYLRYTKIPESCLAMLPKGPRMSGELERFYFIYVHLRQTGKWGECLRGRREGENPSLKNIPAPEKPCPVLLAHSREDPDVPFGEFEALSARYPEGEQLEVPLAIHDFDSDPSGRYTKELLQMSVDFIRRHS
jgi:acetyl esterase/lipase